RAKRNRRICLASRYCIAISSSIRCSTSFLLPLVGTLTKHSSHDQQSASFGWTFTKSPASLMLDSGSIPTLVATLAIVGAVLLRNRSMPPPLGLAIGITSASDRSCFSVLAMTYFTRSVCGMFRSFEGVPAGSLPGGTPSTFPRCGGTARRCLFRLMPKCVRAHPLLAGLHLIDVVALGGRRRGDRRLAVIARLVELAAVTLGTLSDLRAELARDGVHDVRGPPVHGRVKRSELVVVEVELLDHEGEQAISRRLALAHELGDLCGFLLAAGLLTGAAHGDRPFGACVASAACALLAAPAVGSRGGFRHVALL